MAKKFSAHIKCSFDNPVEKFEKLWPKVLWEKSKLFWKFLSHFDPIDLPTLVLTALPKKFLSSSVFFAHNTKRSKAHKFLPNVSSWKVLEYTWLFILICWLFKFTFLHNYTFQLVDQRLSCQLVTCGGLCKKMFINFFPCVRTVTSQTLQIFW